MIATDNHGGTRPHGGWIAAAAVAYLVVSLLTLDYIYYGQFHFLLKVFDLPSAPVCMANREQIDTDWPVKIERPQLADREKYTCDLQGYPDYENATAGQIEDTLKGSRDTQGLKSQPKSINEPKTFRLVGEIATRFGLFLFALDIFFLWYCISSVLRKGRQLALGTWWQKFCNVFFRTGEALFEPPGQIFLAVGILGTFFGLGLALVESFDFIKAMASTRGLASGSRGIPPEQMPAVARLVACVSVSVISSLHGAFLSLTCRVLAGVLGIAEPSAHKFYDAFSSTEKKTTSIGTAVRTLDEKIDAIKKQIDAITVCRRLLNAQFKDRGLPDFLKRAEAAIDKISSGQMQTAPAGATAAQMAEAFEPRFEELRKAINTIPRILEADGFVTDERADKKYATKGEVNAVLGGLGEAQQSQETVEQRIRTLETEFKDIKLALDKLADALRDLTQHSAPAGRSPRKPRASKKKPEGPSDDGDTPGT